MRCEQGALARPPHEQPRSSAYPSMHPGMPPGANGAPPRHQQPLGAGGGLAYDAQTLEYAAQTLNPAQLGGLGGGGAVSAPAADEGYREYFRCAAAAGAPQGARAAHPAVMYGGDGLGAGYAAPYAGAYGGAYGDGAGAEAADTSSAAAWGSAMGGGLGAQARRGAPGDAACRQATYAWQQGAKCGASSP